MDTHFNTIISNQTQSTAPVQQLIESGFVIIPGPVERLSDLTVMYDDGTGVSGPPGEACSIKFGQTGATISMNLGDGLIVANRGIGVRGKGTNSAAPPYINSCVLRHGN